jgi:uncharacterized protein YpmB
MAKQNRFITDKEPKRFIHILTFLIIVLIVDMCSYFAFSPIYRKPVTTDCTKCHNKKAELTRYFKKSGSKTPEQMAEAVLKTKSPRLMAAIHIGGEKGTPYTVRNGGYKKRHAGAWQMSKRNQKAYGVVPIDPVGQALQAERLLDDLVADEKDIVKALNAYGGESNKKRGKYAYNVLDELRQVP